MTNLVSFSDVSLEKGVLNCAWHIRLGDDVFAKEEGLQNALRAVLAAAGNRTIAHHVFANGKMCTAPHNYYCGMHGALVKAGTTFWPDAKEKETLEMFIRFVFFEEKNNGSFLKSAALILR